MSLSKATCHSLLVIACVASVARFVGTAESPPGFFYDEATGAAHSLCYQQTGYDLFAERGLFSAVDFSGFQSAPFLIGSATWTSVVGNGPAGYRTFMAMIGVLTVLGSYCMARNLQLGRETALWTAALAACLPWAFHFSRVSWDAPLGLALLVWGLVLIYSRPADESEKAGALRWFGAGLLLALASYTYSPIRLQTSLMLLLLPGVRWRPRLFLLGLFFLANVPVLLLYGDPEFASRAGLLALTSEDPRNPFRDANAAGLVLAYVQQMFDHFSPDFLLWNGDQNLRHSVPGYGMLNGVTFAGLVAGMLLMAKQLMFDGAENRQIHQFASVAILGLVAGLTVAALTWDSIPHALRANGAWPFMVLVAAWGIKEAVPWPMARLMLSGALVVSFSSFLHNYMTVYPENARWWFDVDIIENIQAGRGLPDHYLPVARAYHQMSAYGMSCVEVRETLGVQ